MNSLKIAIVSAVALAVATPVFAQSNMPEKKSVPVAAAAPIATPAVTPATTPTPTPTKVAVPSTPATESKPVTATAPSTAPVLAKTAEAAPVTKHHGGKKSHKTTDTKTPATETKTTTPGKK